MYSEAIEALIEAILADGEITEKERAVLHKRAVAEGIDPDEIDVVIDGRLAKMLKEERRQKAPATATYQPRKSDKYGELRKCPACGEVVETGSVKCVSCGYTFVGIRANSSVERLSEKINSLEAKFASGDSSFLKNEIIRVFSMGMDDRTRSIQTAIETFPVPTTKEDLMEFILYLKPKSKKILSGSHSEMKISESYKKKYDECVEKARHFFGNDPQMEAILPKKKGFFGLF